MGLNIAIRRPDWRAAVAAGLCALSLAGVPAVVQAQVRELPDFTELAERMSPTVVNIRTTERVRSAQGGGEMDDQMREFFRRFGIPLPNTPRRNGPPTAPDEESAPQQRGVGSGFILSADGKRDKWEIAGPFFGGWEIYHLKGSPVDPNRIYASQGTGWFGQLMQRSDDGGTDPADGGHRAASAFSSAGRSCS